MQVKHGTIQQGSIWIESYYQSVSLCFLHIKSDIIYFTDGDFAIGWLGFPGGVFVVEWNKDSGKNKNGDGYKNCGYIFHFYHPLCEFILLIIDTMETSKFGHFFNAF